MCTVMDLTTSILASLFSALMFTGFHNQFPLLTMDKDKGKILYFMLSTRGVVAQISRAGGSR